MSLPPPLPPSKKSPPRPLGTPVGVNLPSGTNTRVVRKEDISPASPLPIALSVVAIISSIILLFIFRSKYWIVAFIGYLLTPFSVILLSGIDAILQRKGVSQKSWFLPKPQFATILRILSAISLVVAYFHINGLADYLAVQIASIWPAG